LPARVAESDAGLTEWTCEPGELELEDGRCLPAGVDACGAGFVPADDGCAAATLACAPGSMALPGQTRCQPVAGCGAGTWGDIPIEDDAQYVDASFVGTSDGSATSPWTSVQAAVDAAADGAMVAIAAGTYAEKVTVDKPVRIWGRCPALVTITAGESALSVRASATEVHDLAVVSPVVALHVDTATGVRIDRVWVHDSGIVGMDVESGAPEVTITRSLVESTMGIGIFGYGAALTIEDSVVRGIAQTPDGEFGQGIRVFDEPEGAPSVLTVRRSVVADGFDDGIAAYGSPLLVEDTLVQNISPSLAGGENGSGISVFASPFDGAHAPAIVRGSVVERTHWAAIQGENTDLTVERTSIRDVNPPPATPRSFGIALARDEDPVASRLTVRSTLIERARTTGIAVVDAGAVIEAVVVRDMLPSEEPLVPGMLDRGGWAIGGGTHEFPDEPHTIEVRGSRLERLHEVAVAVIGGDVALESVLVRDVHVRDADGRMGRAVTVQPAIEPDMPSTALIKDSLIEGTGDAAIAVIDSLATVESTWIRDTFGSGDGTGGHGIVVQGRSYTSHGGAARVDHALIENSRDAGVVVIDADLELTSSIVRDTQARADGTFGDGVGAVSYRLPGSQLDIRDTLIEHSARAGITLFGARAALLGSYLDCNVIDLDGESFTGTASAFADGGANLCGCGSDARTCKVMNAGLAPPEPLAP
jgi:hypothetical protein